MKYISLFSGIEAASIAWEPLGWEPMAFAEVDEFPSVVLAERWPDVPNLGDVRDIDWSGFVREHGRPDVVVGGSPCQSFSLSGGRASLDGESRLMYEYIRACKDIRSPWILWENVPGVLNVRDKAFGQLIRSLQDVGYVDLAWRVLDAQFFRVAQRRRRVYLVGHLGVGGCSSAVLFEPESVRGNTQTSKQKRKALTEDAGGRAGRTGVDPTRPRLTTLSFKVRGGSKTYIKVDGTVGTAGKGALVSDELAFTVAASQDQTIADGRTGRYLARRLTPLECERLQGMPDGHTDIGGCDVDEVTERVASSLRYDAARRARLGKRVEKWSRSCPDSPRYRAIGNSFAVPVVRWIGERIQMVDETLREGSSEARDD